MIYGATDLAPDFLAVDTTSEYEAFAFWYEIETHTHTIVIPTGAIDGSNMSFSVTADQLEVMLNGVHVDFTTVVGGFTLDTPPTAGDILWCEVILGN